MLIDFICFKVFAYFALFYWGLGIKDRRFTIEKLSSKWFDISVSDVTFKDGGEYRCTQYGSVATKKVFRVTVLGELLQ
jgi:hypothetical protein